MLMRWLGVRDVPHSHLQTTGFSPTARQVLECSGSARPGLHSRDRARPAGLRQLPAFRNLHSAWVGPRQYLWRCSRGDNKIADSATRSRLRGRRLRTSDLAYSDGPFISSDLQERPCPSAAKESKKRLQHTSKEKKTLKQQKKYANDASPVDQALRSEVLVSASSRLGQRPGFSSRTHDDRRSPTETCKSRAEGRDRRDVVAYALWGHTHSLCPHTRLQRRIH